VGELGSMVARSPLLALFTSRLQSDFGYERVAFYATGEGGVPRARRPRRARAPAARRSTRSSSLVAARDAPAASAPGVSPATLAVPVRAGDAALGVLEVVCDAGGPFSDDDANLLSTLAGQLAAALQRAASVAETERLAAQMATLYDVGWRRAPCATCASCSSRPPRRRGR
jgi:GAF domain-containing protein